MRLVDGPALWRSKKLKTVPAEFRAEYANLLPLAEANGAFEFDADSIWADVYAFNRPDVSPERCSEILASFVDAGMITTHEQDGKTWGYFEGIDKPGRLPSPAHQARYGSLPPLPVMPKVVYTNESVVIEAPSSPSGNRPIESAVEDLIRDVIGFAEERVHWKKEIRDAVKTHGYDVVLASLSIWLEGQRVFTGKRPVSTFLRSLPSLAAAGARPATSATSPALQTVEDEIALLSNNLVVFGNSQKPHLALMVKESGPDAVLHVFREFWGELDDFGKKWAARDFIEKGPQFLRTNRIKEVQRAEQEERAAATRAALQSEGEAELAALEQADAQQAANEADAFAEFEK
jgi:hypothetical protein